MTEVTASSPGITAPAAARKQIEEYGPGFVDPPLEKASAKLNSLSKRVADTLYQMTPAFNKVFFRSAPAGPAIPEKSDSWKFAAIGDYGLNTPAQVEVAQRLLERDPKLVLTLGDNAYPNGREQDFQKRWDPDHLFGKIAAEKPVYPTLGNHDVREGWPTPYFKRFPDLDNARYYSFDQGDVHFVALDSNEQMSPTSEQGAWLDQDLANNDSKFTVLYMHHPMRSGMKRNHDSQRVQQLGPLIAKHGVELVINGHDHWYERSKPEANGTMLVTAGGGGASAYPFMFSQPEWSAFRRPAFGHLEVEVGANELVGRLVQRNGKIGDTFRVSPVAPQPAVDAAAGAQMAQPALAAA